MKKKDGNKGRGTYSYGTQILPRLCQSVHTTAFQDRRSILVSLTEQGGASGQEGAGLRITQLWVSRGPARNSILFTHISLPSHGVGGYSLSPHLASSGDASREPPSPMARAASGDRQQPNRKGRKEGAGTPSRPAGCHVRPIPYPPPKERPPLPVKADVCACLQTVRKHPSCDPMDHSPPGFSVHGALRARILEWVAMPS